MNFADWLQIYTINKKDYIAYVTFFVEMAKPTTLQSYYLSKPEPYRSCLLALRDLILSVNPGICHERKFQIPFFIYKDKKLGYLWLNRKKLMLGFCHDKSLQPSAAGAKPKDKYESMQIDPNEDLPVDIIFQKLEYYLDLIG